MSSIKLTAFGDSVTTGTSAKLDVFHDCFKFGTTTVNLVRETQTWRSILARILTDWVEDDVEVSNAGVSGDTSSNALTRLEADVLAGAPNYVLVMFGIEDVLQDVAPDKFRKNLEKIISGIKARNGRPILMTPTPISERMTAADVTLDELRPRQERLSQLAQVVRGLAGEKSLPLIDLNQYFLDNRLAYDHLHAGWLPDAVAQTAMASFVAGELLPLLGINDFPAPTLCDYRKAYRDTSGSRDWRHNAFTDLTFFEGQFYLTFRNGAGHCPPPPPSGRVIVLRSSDAITWEQEATLVLPNVEHQADPKFLQVDGRLFIYTLTAGDVKGVPKRRMTYGFERLSPGKWGEFFECAECSFWRPKKWREQYVAAGYSGKLDENGKSRFGVDLYQSPDGRDWEKVSSILDHSTDGNETDLLVEGDKLTAYGRCGAGNNEELMICSYIPSENRWETVSSGRLIHAPCVFKLGDRTLITGRYCSQSDNGFRDLRRDWNAFNYDTEGGSVKTDPARVEEYHHGLRTGVFVMAGTKPRLVMELLSAGDSSYTGVVPYGDEFVISDYSMHEYYPEIKRPGDWNTPNDIYVSRIRFGK